MTDYEAYQLFNSLKMHFTSESYDYFKYNGKIKTTLKGFEQRSDKYFYQKLSKHRDPQKFILANLVDGDRAKWIGNLIKDEECDRIFLSWTKRQQSLTYIFTNEIKLLDSDFNSNFIVENQYPKLFSLFLDKKICYETLIILNDLVKFIPHWSKKINDPVLYPAVEFKMHKYKPFLSYDLNKMKGVILQNNFH